MRTELFISWRYLITKRKEKFISLISLISVLGIAIGVMALIIVIAVMSGFDKDLREKIVGNYSHITITGFSGLDNQAYENILKKAGSNPHILGISPQVQGQVLLRDANRYFAVGIKGIDPLTENQVSKLDKYLISGSLENLNKDAVIIGKELAAYMGLHKGSSLNLITPQGKPRVLNVAGVFNSGMYDYDLNLIFTDVKTAQEILNLGNLITSVSVKLDNIDLAGQVKNELAASLGFDYSLKTWSEMNQNFFAALQLEKLTMFIILTLIILVASFNIVSSLVVLVVDKTKDIGILKAIGLSDNRIRRIFTLEGFVIGGLGTFFGAVGGVGLCLLLKKYQFIKLPQDVYYLDRLPVSIVFWPDLVLTILAAMLITLASTIYPAAKAAKLKPVEALRYE